MKRLLLAAALLLPGAAWAQQQGTPYANGGVQFTCTTTDQAISGLPTITGNKPIILQIQNPQYTDAGAANSTPVLVGWHGENTGSSASTETLSPGQTDQFTVTTTPHCSVPSGTAVIKVVF